MNFAGSRVGAVFNIYSSKPVKRILRPQTSILVNQGLLNICAVQIEREFVFISLRLKFFCLSAQTKIENRDGALKPEMFANFRILTGDAAESPAVPEAAVVYEGDAAHVWVVAGDGLLSLRAIRAGRSSDGLIEVLDGLKPGERVVTKGGLFIDQAAVPASS